MIINKGYIKKSTLHGYGVFAKEDIKAGEVIEQAICPTQVIEPKYEYLDGQVYIENIDTMSYYRFTGPNNMDIWIIPSGKRMKSCYLIMVQDINTIEEIEDESR